MVEAGPEERERAFDRLEQAWWERSINMISLAIDPPFVSLRGDQRFQDLLRRINYPKSLRATTSAKPSR